MKSKGLVTVLSGFSGAGKGTIMKHLLEEYPDTYFLSISATTRTPRPGEQNGREYFFMSEADFENMIENNDLLEYAKFNGNYYGTPRDYVEEMLDEGKNVLLEIEVQGALQVKKIYPEALLLFVTPPSAEELKNRLVGRQTDDPDVILSRLSIAYDESHLMDKYDYLIVNSEIEDAVEEVHTIINAERYRTARRTEMIEKMQNELLQYKKGDK